MVARFIYEGEVLGNTNVVNPSDTAYAVAAGNVLPAGLMGLMVIVLFAATMSNMDTGLNYTAGIFVRNILHPLRRMFGREGQVSSGRELRIGQLVTGVNATLMILLALVYSRSSAMGILELAYTANVIIVFPMAVPILVGTWVKRLPKWAYFFGFGCALVPAISAVVSGAVFDRPWSLQEKTFSVVGVGIAAMLATVPFYRFSSAQYQRRIELFFRKMRTPIERPPGKEGQNKAVELLQRRIMGSTCLWAGGIILFLLFVPTDTIGRLSVVFIAAFVSFFGLLLRLRSGPRHGREDEETHRS